MSTDTSTPRESAAEHEPDSALPRPRVRRRLSKGPEARQRRRRVWTYGLLAISTMLMVNALMGEKGYLANMQAQRELEEVSASLQQLRSENESLKDEAHRLKTDPFALEDAAREQLDLIKPGETLITIRDRPSTHR